MSHLKPLKNGHNYKNIKDIRKEVVMKEIRLCDDGDLDNTFKLCIENNLGIEIQGFYNP